MLRRFTPLALVLLAACDRTSSMASSTLIGSWRMDRGVANLDGLHTRAEIDEALAEFESKGVRLTETFASDGKWTAHAEALGIPTDAASTWTVLEDHPDRVTVRIAESPDGLGSFDRTLVFEGQDRMRESYGSSDPVWFTRVTGSK